MAIAKVLLVSGSANFSTRDVWDGYRHGLEAAGVQVIPYPTFSFLKVLSVDAVCNDILGTAVDIANQIDCVIFVDGLFFRGGRMRVPQSIRQAGIPTALVATDDPYETHPHAESLYTYRFSNEIRCAGDGVTYLPTATLPLPQVPRVAQPRYDVSFLGTVFSDRRPLLLKVAEFCQEAGLRFLIAGKILDGTADFERFAATELRQRTIDPLEKWEIYSQSRLTINLFRETEKPVDSPSPRVYEVTAFGHAALLTGPPRAEVTRLYGESVYHFEDAASAIEAIQTALADEASRIARTQKARQITLESGMYEHRAAALVAALRQGEQQRSVAGTAEDRIAWIIGCGRTGSTWLAEMLGELPAIRRWHEPYYGRFFRHVQERPEELKRPAAFFTRRHRHVWLDGLRNLFFEMVRDRYPQFGEHSLVIKEVNTPELYDWLLPLFPSGKVILLLRDPFDVLDSYLDLQQPDSWNTKFSETNEPLSEANVQRTANHIGATLRQALAAFENFPLEQRLSLRYEDLLADPVPYLIACGGLVGVNVDEASAGHAAEKHAFKNYRQSGPGQFRRSGKAGVWKTSENFTDEVRQIAQQTLGPLRTRLGYA